MGTTVTLKSAAELKSIAQQGDSSKKIDEKLMFLFDFIGDTTINIDEIIVTDDGVGGKKFTFINNNLDPARNFYDIKIPEAWCVSYDLADNAENLYCKSCSFMTKPDSPYQFGGRVLVSGEAGTATAVYRKETFRDRLDNNKDIVCPVCFKRNRFSTLG